MKIHRFHVTPNLPPRLEPLLQIVRNLWWSWNPDAIDLFRRLDNDLWQRTRHNPAEMLGLVTPEQYRALLQDDVFLSHMDRVSADLEKYKTYSTWFDRVQGEAPAGTIGYFSLEFGLHESLQIYSGGLGILAGDHLKSASDLGVPLVGVGLLYRRGYFHQRLNHDGWQQEHNPAADYFNLPVVRERLPDGSPATVTVEYPEGPLTAAIWRVQVGRVPVFLLDADLEPNRLEHREITGQLYGGDNDLRIRQEILLGIGGIRALNKLGLTPAVCHMNEGHSAFLALERVADFMQQHQLGFEEARVAVAATNVFTTHTPVPAGNDIFSIDRVRTYFSAYCQRLGIGMEEFLALGQEGRRLNPSEGFCMTVLALHMASHRNGVSALHGSVSRRMWQGVWPGVPEHELPITHITNGIHTQSWLSDEMARLYNRYLGPRWLEDPVDQRIWERVVQIPDSELWRSHERLRARLVAYSRRRLREQLERRGAHRSTIRQADEVLDPEVLTVGFSRRFAAYKRATLILQDPDRLARIVNHQTRPVQLIFAGKAHPRDSLGKELIRKVVHFAKQERFRRRLVFIEDYDIAAARYLVQGCDVWLNNPRRPLEASGTSGMKVVPNGGVNLSVLDGWWCEGYRGNNGWVIGNAEDYGDPSRQDEVEGLALYDLLEKEVVPMFYNRGPDNLPREWIGVMKASIRTGCPVFNTNRMLEQYCKRFYMPALVQARRLTENHGAEARRIAAWQSFLRAHWHEVGVTEVSHELNGEIKVGQTLSIRVRVRLGAIPPEDVVVEAYLGKIDSAGAILDGEAVRLTHRPPGTNGEHVFEGDVPCRTTGQQGYTVRVLPMGDSLTERVDAGLIAWWNV
ncbi:MAG: alpha-glucan family phosphorylase [Planctomycetes bacterium]|nr:alpha-glucan family phosphorylase [Planctomycetota bacterium]